MIEYIDGSMAIIKDVKSQDDFTLDSLNNFVEALENASTYEEILEVLSYEI